MKTQLKTKNPNEIRRIEMKITLIFQPIEDLEIPKWKWASAIAVRQSTSTSLFTNKGSGDTSRRSE